MQPRFVGGAHKKTPTLSSRIVSLPLRVVSWLADPEARSNPARANEQEEQAMESVIAKLLQDFEQGKMNRRRLIQSLSRRPQRRPGYRAGGQGRRQAARSPLRQPHLLFGEPLQEGPRLLCGFAGDEDHRDDGKQCRLVFGNNILIPRNRAGGGPARVDHIAYTVTNWEAEKDGGISGGA